MWQVVEKQGIYEWSMVRYYDKALSRFPTEEAATKAAHDYLTERNCNNALTKEEKLGSFEVFMDTPEGIFLGNLDGKPWYLKHPKDINDEKKQVFVSKGDVVKDKKFFLLNSKTEVAVRVLPGT